MNNQNNINDQNMKQSIKIDNTNNTLLTENQKLRDQINILTNENNTLKATIASLTNYKNNLQSTLADKNTEINNLLTQINTLNNQIASLNTQLNNLRFGNNQMNNLIINNNVNAMVNRNEIIAVLFKSIDQKVEMPCACHIAESFVTIEQQLYKEYPELIDCNTYFTVNGKTVNRFKTIAQNNIKNYDRILLNLIE